MIKSIFKLIKLAALYVASYGVDIQIFAWAVTDFIKFITLDIVYLIKKRARTIYMAISRINKKKTNEHHKT